MKDTGSASTTPTIVGLIPGKKQAQSAIGVGEDKWKLLRIIGLTPVRFSFDEKSKQYFSERELIRHMKRLGCFFDIAQRLHEAGVLREVVGPLFDGEEEVEGKT